MAVPELSRLAEVVSLLDRDVSEVRKEFCIYEKGADLSHLPLVLEAMSVFEEVLATTKDSVTTFSKHKITSLKELFAFQTSADAEHPKGLQKQLVSCIEKDLYLKYVEAAAQGRVHPAQKAFSEEQLSELQAKHKEFLAGRLSASQHGASRWLSAQPTQVEYRLSNEYFCKAVRHRLQLMPKPRMVKVCVCKQNPRTHHHLDSCRTNRKSTPTARHNLVVEALKKAADEAHVYCEVEVDVKGPDDVSYQKPDLLFFFSFGHMYVDVMITHPCVQTSINKAKSHEKALAAAEYAESRKVKRYKEKLIGGFLPFVMEAHGAFGSEALRLLQMIAEEGARNGHVQEGAFLNRWTKAISFALQLGNAIISSEGSLNLYQSHWLRRSRRVDTRNRGYAQRSRLTGRRAVSDGESDDEHEDTVSNTGEPDLVRDREECSVGGSALESVMADMEDVDDDASVDVTKTNVNNTTAASSSSPSTPLLSATNLSIVSPSSPSDSSTAPTSLDLELEAPPNVDEAVEAPCDTSSSVDVSASSVGSSDPNESGYEFTISMPESKSEAGLLDSSTVVDTSADDSQASATVVDAPVNKKRVFVASQVVTRRRSAQAIAKEAGSRASSSPS
jgi:hypothetical protein